MSEVETSTRLSCLRDDFEKGRISRRVFMQGTAALGLAASAPLMLGARHAAAQAAETCDYIVVGAGSAGCALASRLSEDGSRKVLVLEAGPPDENPFIHIPAAFPNLFGTELDWAFRTTEQAGAGNRPLYSPRGKVYGGCSSMNAQIYKRGNAAVFDAWGTDNPGWRHADLLPVFQRMEDDKTETENTLGKGGPLTVSKVRDPNVLTNAMIEAAVQAG